MIRPPASPLTRPPPARPSARPCAHGSMSSWAIGLLGPGPWALALRPWPLGPAFRAIAADTHGPRAHGPMGPRTQPRAQGLMGPWARRPMGPGPQITDASVMVIYYLHTCHGGMTVMACLMVARHSTSSRMIKMVALVHGQIT